MGTDFDEIIERRASGCVKWTMFPDDVLPLWVADMDFRVAPPIIEALHQRVEHGIYGYALPPAALAEAICAWLAAQFAWQVTPEQIIYFPSVVVGLNSTAHALAANDAGFIFQPPIYPPILMAPDACGRPASTAPLIPVPSGQTLRYEIDFAALKAAAAERPGILLLCNPHNPTGRAFTRDELLQIAEICEQHNLTIISDEIWSDLTLGDVAHIPIASLAPEIAARTVTLMAPSKTFNLPGLGLSFGVVASETLRKQILQSYGGHPPLPNVMGTAAALAAYTAGDPWLRELRGYLTANRDATVAYLAEHLPQLRTTVPDASYLAWIDCREAGIDGNPFTFFLEQAKVALTDGATFGPGGEGFVRLNMGCPRPVLLEGLERMRRALAELVSGGPASTTSAAPSHG